MTKETYLRLSRDLASEFDADHPASTIVLARTILVDSPNHGPTLTRLGHALSELANYEEAESVLMHALECCEESWCDIVFGKLGHLFKIRGDFELAAQ